MTDLYYRQAGDGPDLVLIHGLFGSADNLGMVARGLTDAYKVTSVDLRDHGRSPHTSSISYPEMAADIIAVMDKLGIDQAHIFGHSMGGKTAMELAATHPDRLAKLIVGDIAPLSYGDNHTAVLKAQEAVAKAGEAITSRNAAEAIMAPYIEEEGVLPFLLTNLRRGKGGAYEWRHNLDLIMRDYPNIAAAPSEGFVFDRPALFIKGAKSDYITNEATEAVKARFSQPKIHILSGTGHWFHADKPEATLKVITEFLSA